MSQMEEESKILSTPLYFRERSQSSDSDHKAKSRHCDIPCPLEVIPMYRMDVARSVVGGTQTGTLRKYRQEVQVQTTQQLGCKNISVRGRTEHSSSHILENERRAFFLVNSL